MLGRVLCASGRKAAAGYFCHENGHLLCRFPDMYDYGDRDGDSIQSAGIGAYCLMGSGNHNNVGRTPSPVCGYLRELAGWCDRVVTLSDQSGQISVAHGEYGTVLKYATDKPNEYFIIENRSKLGLDQAFPSSGLALYHCDTLGSNELQEGTATRHYQCALLQADGHFDLEHNVNRGDGGDLYGIVSGIALSHTTTPSSRQWDGSDSQLVVSRVSSAGTTIDFTLGSQASLQNIRGESVPALAIPDNNPAGVSNAITISQPGILQSIKVSVDITHTYIGDLVVELTNPTGVMARLHNRTGASQDNLIVSYDSATVSSLAPFVGKAVQGSWTLTARDVAGVDVGKLNRWIIDIGIGVSNQVITVSATPALKIPDNNATGVSSQIVVSQSGVIRQAKVSVKITHTYVGDLRVELLAPSGKRAILHSRLGGGQDNLDMNYDTFPGSPINALIGESVQGSWVLRVADLEGQDIGTVDSWALEFVTGS